MLAGGDIRSEAAMPREGQPCPVDSDSGLSLRLVRDGRDASLDFGTLPGSRLARGTGVRGPATQSVTQAPLLRLG